MNYYFSLLGVAALALNATAATVTFSGVANDEQVSATAEYTFTNNTLVIELTNNVINPKSVGQAISGIDFSVTGGLTGSLVTKTGELINVGKNGVVASQGNVALDWLQLDGFYTTALGSSGPDQTILGQPDAVGLYSNANGSIAKNNPHNPFVRYRAILTYAIPGATDKSALKTFAFLFGTGPERIPVTIDGGGQPSAVPEPTSMALLGGGIGAIYLAGRHRKNKAE